MMNIEIDHRDAFGTMGLPGVLCARGSFGAAPGSSLRIVVAALTFCTDLPAALSASAALAPLSFSTSPSPVAIAWRRASPARSTAWWLSTRGSPLRRTGGGGGPAQAEAASATPARRAAVVDGASDSQDTDGNIGSGVMDLRSMIAAQASAMALRRYGGNALDLNVSIGIHRLQREQLRHDVVGRRVVNLHAQEDDALFEQLRIRVVDPLAVGGALAELRNDVSAGWRLRQEGDVTHLALPFLPGASASVL